MVKIGLCGNDENGIWAERMTESSKLFLRSVAPTGLTLGNAIAGFAALVAANRFDPTDKSTWSHIYTAVAFLILAMIFDALDGLAARVLRCASDFGAELDSLCDGVSFGLVPAFLVWMVFGQMESPIMGRVWGLVASLYLACTLLRLARFNMERSRQDKAEGKKFVGLPSPAAAGCICGIVLLQGRVEFANQIPFLFPKFGDRVEQILSVLFPFAASLIAILMISRIGFPHPTRKILGPSRQQHKKRKGKWLPSSVALLAILGLAPIWIGNFDLMVALGFWWFAMNGPFQALLGKLQKKTQHQELPAKVD